MTLIINLTPSEEARVLAVANKIGIAPSEWVKKLVEANLPVETGDLIPAERHNSQNRTLATYDAEDAQSLFARWAAEDALLTDEERKANERIYTEIETTGIPRVKI